MNSATLARSAYSQVAAITPTDRSVEYKAFAQITSGLASARAETGPAAFARLSEAVNLNRRLWSILAADVASDDNQLPDETRAQILSLASFTRQHSEKILRREADADVLIEINSSIMRGLRGQDQE
ncbi:MAG: flagellar biosynthesis regulator FlaF [Pseudomonadota bacterium]